MGSGVSAETLLGAITRLLVRLLGLLVQVTSLANPVFLGNAFSHSVSRAAASGSGKVIMD